MVAGSYLFDTNIVVDELAGNYDTVAQYRIEDNFFISSITLGELMFGAFKSTRTDENLNRLEDFLLKASVLEVGTGTAQEYGRIKQQLKLIGRPIPDNDIWIAATAIEHRLLLVSHDNHFAHVERLNWVRPS